MSKSARYHARRRTALIARLGSSCNECYTPDAMLEIDHIHGGGNEARRTRGNAGEITRLLNLPDEALHATVQVLCPPCHADKTALQRAA